MNNLSQDELIAMLTALQGEKDALANQVQTLQAKKKKTKRKKAPRPDFHDFVCFYPLLTIPPKLPQKEKKDFIQKLIDYGVEDESFIKELIKTAKDKDGNTKIKLFKTIDYEKGKSIQRIIILHDPDVVVNIPPAKEGSISHFSLMGEVDISPEPILQEFYNNASHLHNKEDDPECPGEWFIEAITTTRVPLFVPTEDFVATKLLRPTKEELVEVFECTMLDIGDLSPANYFKRKLLLISKDKLVNKSTSGKGEYVGTTLSKQKDEDGNEVVVDLTDPEVRKKFIKIKYEGEKRCDCLMEKKGKQRCTGEAKWLLPNGRRFCSAHGGNVLQTNYLLQLAGQEPADYEKGVRAGWCEKNCKGHDCKCEKNASQQELCKSQYSALTESQVQAYKDLKNRFKTSYDELFKAYEM